MAKRKAFKARKLSDWHRGDRRILAPGGGVGYLWRWHTSLGDYRIDHYTSYGELPFFVFAYRPDSGIEGAWAYLDRFATLEKAKRACERNRREQPQENGRPEFNELGDPIIPFRERAKRKKTR